MKGKQKYRSTVRDMGQSGDTGGVDNGKFKFRKKVKIERNGGWVFVRGEVHETKTFG